MGEGEEPPAEKDEEPVTQRQSKGKREKHERRTFFRDEKLQISVVSVFFLKPFHKLSTWHTLFRIRMAK